MSDISRTEFNHELFGQNTINNAVKTSQVRNEFILVPNDVSELRDVTVGSGKNETFLSAEESFKFPFIRQKPVAIQMKSLTGTDATVDISIRFEEDW